MPLNVFDLILMCEDSHIDSLPVTKHHLTGEHCARQVDDCSIFIVGPIRLEPIWDCQPCRGGAIPVADLP